MTWAPVLKKLRDLLGTEDETLLRGKWSAFMSEAGAASAEPPYHIARLKTEIDAYRGEAPKGSVRILDHGCGPASTLLWLAANGYENIWGVDVGGDFTGHNRLARVCLGAKEDRFSVYEGTRLPFEDRSIDVVLSQQVLEHVDEPFYESYYAEEGRVLKPGGFAYHQVPHKLVPYDSHTNRWLVHMLPEGLAKRVMPLTGVDYPDHLHLRWPWRHLGMLRRHVGEPRNLSAERLGSLADLPYYDGPKSVRAALSKLCRMPVAGRAISSAASQMVLMETLTKRRA
jgi:SAM-dependent methyltransferase